MEVTGYLVDWPRVVKLSKGAALDEAVYNGLENNEPWIESLDFYTDSQALYFAVAEAYEEFCDALPAAVRKKADEFMNQLITYDECCNDLVDDSVALSISPESAAKLSALGDSLDLKAFKKAFDAECSDDTKEIFGEDEPEHAFDENFLPYMEMWISALKEAAKQKKGILIFMD